MITSTDIRQVIDSYIQEIQRQDFPSKEITKKYNNNAKIEKILNILVGTCRSTRLGPKPLSLAIATIIENIKFKIQSGLPLNASICFGCKKTWELCPPGIDLAEIFTFYQLLRLSKCIKDIYPPGITFKMYFGDAWYEYIYQDDFGIVEYREGWQGLLNLDKNLKLNLISMHQFHRDNPNLYKKCDGNFELLKEYWDESSATEEKNWQHLQSYKKLQKVGWIGILPTIMRTHYFKKMDRYLPNSDRVEREKAVLKFFSYGLMLNQFELLKRQDPNECTVDISFLSQPPGMPKQLRGNRLYVRSLPPVISTRGAPCWTIMGILFKDSNGSLYPATLSPRDCIQNSMERFDEFEYTFYKNRNLKIIVPIYNA